MPQVSSVVRVRLITAARFNFKAVYVFCGLFGMLLLNIIEQRPSVLASYNVERTSVRRKILSHARVHNRVAMTYVIALRGETERRV